MKITKKKSNAVNINFILILSVIGVMVVFALSNYVKFNKAEVFLNELDSHVTSSDIEIDDEEIDAFVEGASRFGIDAGNVGLDILRVVFTWIPLIHALSLLFYAGLAWLIYKPGYGNTLAYRILMTIAYLNIIVTIAVLVVVVIIHYSMFKKIKMVIFIIQCVSVLVMNFYLTYSKRIHGNVLDSKKHGYDRENQIPVIRASICTGEQVAGFKDISTGKFEEAMLIKDEKDMDKFLKKYKVQSEDIKKEW